MLQVLLIMFALGPSLTGPAVVTGPDPLAGPRPVTDKDVLAWSGETPYCANYRQEQRAMEQRLKGMSPDCAIKPKTRDSLDRNEPRQ